jgi:hypothetical protein
MPSLNQVAYLEQAARSALTQSHTDLELIVADGGSTDSSLAVLAKLSEQFPGRVRWSSGADAGPADAINRAVALARGEIIGWLNSDDLYARGAVRRAVRYLQRNAGAVMVYGNAKTIDACGHVHGDYPTRTPSAGLSGFRDGCFVCQPTAFLRRAAFLDAGGLDATLRASFDFDLWLRLFDRYDGRIGYLPRLQAYARLHDRSITRRLREDVALEAARLLARHFGSAPAHWVLTRFDELCDAHPFHAHPLELSAELARLAEAARTSLSREGRALVQQRIANDRNVELSTRNLYVQVHHDGWAGPTMDVRLRQDDPPVREIRLQCRHASPVSGQPLRLRAFTPRGVQCVDVSAPGAFELCLPVEDERTDARLVFRIASQDSFVPARVEKGSTDGRALAFQVNACHLVADAQPLQEYAN